MSSRITLSAAAVRALARYALPASIVALVLLCFLRVLDNAFVNFDDLFSFVSNPHYRGLSPVHLEWMFTTLYMGHYQPLSWLTHALVYEVSGVNPMAFHLVNLLLHAANAVLFYWLIVALLRRVRSEGGAPRLGLHVAAAAGALLFALHPLRVEAVAWATERREVLCAFFLLLTVLAYLRAQEEVHVRSRYLSWLLASIACYALSLLSKATGMTLAVVLLILDVYPLRRFAGPADGLRANTAAFLEKLPYALMAGAVAAVALTGVRHEAALSLAQYGAMQRLMQAFYGLCFYLWKTVAPTRLSPLYPLDLTLDPTAPTYLACMFAVVSLTVALILLRRRYPWALAAWAVYAVTVSPVLGFMQSGPQMTADRYTYLPCLPWAVLGAAGIYRLGTIGASGRLGRSITYSVATVTLAILVVLGVGARAQTRVWKDSLSLWAPVVQLAPFSPYAYNGRGSAHQMAGDLDSALADYTRAVQLKPDYTVAYLGRAYVRNDQGDLDGALADLNQVLRLDARYASAYNKRGMIRNAKGDLDGALADYEQAIRLDPELAHAYRNRGNMRHSRGDLRGALEDFDHAAQLDADDADTLYNRANARKALGDLDGAIADYSAVLRLKPDYATAYNNRGNARRVKGDSDGALADYNEALRLNPSYANAYNNRGAVRRATGDLEGALADYTQAVQLAPSSEPFRKTYERNLNVARQELAERGRGQQN